MEIASSEADLDHLAGRITALERPVLLGLDVDGTLAPIVPDPAEAVVPDEVARALERLAADVVLALVTGRDAAALARMIDLASAWRVTEHGRVIRPPGAPLVRTELTPDAQARLARFTRWAREHAAGAHIEQKGASVVVHVRELLARDAAAANVILTEAKACAEAEGLFVREGRAVVEAEADPGDKGRALREVARRVGAASVVYAGDDRTDEPAIAAASERGIGIFVRSAERPDPPDGARVTIDGPAAVGYLVKRLALG